MKKSIIILSLISILILTSCEKTKNTNEPITETETTQTSVIETESSQTTLTETQISESEINSNENDKSLDDIINQINHIYPGSAGSSLREAAASANIIKWAANNNFDENDVKKSLETFSNNLSYENKEEFLLSLSNVSDMISDMAINWDNYTELLESAGVLKDFENFTPDKNKSLRISKILSSIE